MGVIPFFFSLLICIIYCTSSANVQIFCRVMASLPPAFMLICICSASPAVCSFFIWFLQFNTCHLFRRRQRKKQFCSLLLLRAHHTAVGFIGDIRREGQTLRLSSLLPPSLPPSLLSDSHHLPQLLPPPSHSPDPLPSAVSV